MKGFYRVFLSVVAFSTLAFGQTPSHVQTKYDKATNRTQVLANTLYVLNTADQFVQLQLGGLIWGQQPLFPAEEVVFEFYSFAANPRYKDEGTRSFLATLDGKKVELGTFTYQTISGEKAVKMLPSLAHVGNKVIVERLTVRLAPEQVGALGQAKRIDLRIGDTTIPLNDAHQAIVREFASVVIPAPGTMPAPGSGVEAISASLPVELNGADLEKTLKWLRENLPKYASGPGTIAMTRFVPKEFSGCALRYQLVTGSLLEEVMVDLAALDSNSIRSIKHDDVAFLYFSIRPGAHKIKRGLYSAAETAGQSGLSLTIHPKGASNVTAAFAQAVRLCQPQP